MCVLVVFHFQSRIIYMIVIQRFSVDVLYFLVQGFIYCIHEFVFGEHIWLDDYVRS